MTVPHDGQCGCAKMSRSSIKGSVRGGVELSASISLMDPLMTLIFGLVGLVLSYFMIRLGVNHGMRDYSKWKALGYMEENIKKLAAKAGSSKRD